MTPRSPRRAARGGRGGSEPRAVIAEREAQVWELSLRGLSQRAIAEQVGVSQAAVSKIGSRLSARHAAALAEQAAHHATRAYHRLDFLYAHAIRAFERSQEDDVCKTHRRVQAARPGATAQEVQELRVRKRPGDPRLLQEAREALMAQRQLLPTATPSLPPSWNYAALSSDELATLQRLIDRLQVPAAAVGGGEGR